MGMISGLLLSLILAGPPTEAASRLAVIRKAPDFTLTDQDGKTVKQSDFKGKVLLVSFMFTTCNGTCPATTHRMSKVAQALEGEKVHLVSITLDPKRDTPAVLRD